MAVSHRPLLEFDHAAVIHNDDGTKSLRWHITENRTDATSKFVFSLQPNGTYDFRPDTKIDIWEKGHVEGDRLVFRTENARAVFAWVA